jgi:hypothetical protein
MSEQGYYCGQCGGQCDECKRAEEQAAKKPTSYSTRVQHTLYIILTFALILVLLPWLFRWHYVIWDWYASYILRVLEAS